MYHVPYAFVMLEWFVYGRTWGTAPCLLKTDKTSGAFCYDLIR